MKKQPLVTIVTPSFNQAAFVEETILSVLNQTYSNVEYIFVDGGSSDRTMEIVNKYRDKIDVIIHEKDKGQTDAINKGFRIANGELVGWINSDDILYSNCVQEIVSAYQSNQEASIYYSSQIDIFDEVGRIINVYERKILNREFLLHKKYDVVQQGSFYNLNYVREVGYLDERIKYCMDLDLWLNILEKKNLIIDVCADNKSLAAFRSWGGTKTSNGQDEFVNEIRKILLHAGANFLDKTIIETYYWNIFFLLKRILKK